MKSEAKERMRQIWVAAIKKKLEDFGWTQAQLAAKAGISTKHLNDVLKGRRYGGDEFRFKVASAFGMTPGEMERLGESLLGITPPAPEPFPGFSDVMALPADERYYMVWKLAAKNCGIEVALGFIGDPFERDRVPKLLEEEEVIKAYNEAKEYWERLKKRMDEELRRRGLTVEE